MVVNIKFINENANLGLPKNPALKYKRTTILLV